MKQQRSNIKKNKKRTARNLNLNKLELPNLSHHLIEVSPEKPSLYGCRLMVGTVSQRTVSTINIFKPNFEASCTNPVSMDDKFNVALGLKMNVEDIAAALIAVQDYEKNEETPLPLAGECFNFLSEYVEGARSVISTLMNLFAADDIEQGSDIKILKVLDSLTLAIENINDIFEKYCKTKGMLEA